MNERSVVICTPCAGQVCTEVYLQSFAKTTLLLNEMGIRYGLLTLVNEAMVSRARNELVRLFLDTDYTDMLFIDADQAWEPENVKRVLESPYDIACGVYPKKQFNWEAHEQAIRDGDDHATAMIKGLRFVHSLVSPLEMDQETGFARAERGPTGFMNIRREVLEKMQAHYPELDHMSDPDADKGVRSSGLFTPTMGRDMFIGEDYAFCDRWTEMGGEIWVDLNGPLIRHQGQFVYGSLQP